MKEENKKTILTLILCVVALSSILIIRDTNAINSPTTLANTSVDKYNESEAIVLGNPFYIEHYQDVVRKPEISNESSMGTFTGKGILNGTLNINAEGNSTDIFRNNETVYSQGNAKFVTDNRDVAKLMQLVFTILMALSKVEEQLFSTTVLQGTLFSKQYGSHI